MEYETTNFVQVKHSKRLESGEPVEYWRNALYVDLDDGSHVVIYTDGTLHKLHKDIKIRRVCYDY